MIQILYEKWLEAIRSNKVCLKKNPQLLEEKQRSKRKKGTTRETGRGSSKGCIRISTTQICDDDDSHYTYTG